MSTWIKRALGALIGVALIAAATFLGEQGFNRVLDFRTLERIPPTLVAGSVGGETQLRGVAGEYRETLTTPKSRSETLYYRYLLEREETDSDGDKTWRTIRDESNAVDFLVADNSGEALLRVARTRGAVDWSVSQKYQVREGDLRHTEWRVDAGDRLTIFGWLDPSTTIPEVNFVAQGRYLPIISSRTASEERGSLGVIAILLLAASIACVVFAALATVYVLRVHKTLIFLSIVTAATTLLLMNYGFRSLERDVMDGSARLDEHRARTEAIIDGTIGRYGIDFPGLDASFDVDVLTVPTDEEKQRVKAWRQSAWMVRERFMMQIDRFPENLYAAFRGAGSPPAVTLTPAELSAARQELGQFESTRTGYQLLFSGIGFVLVVIAAFVGFRAIRTKRMQENLTTSKTAGVVYGLTEVEGHLIPDSKDGMLTGPLSGEDCVWFRYVVEEKRGSGKDEKWVTIEDTLKKQPFYCEDDEGRIRVFPSKAEIFTTHRSYERRGDRRYTETRLEPDDLLYILGKAQIDKTSGDTLVLRHSKDSDFIIANETEAEVMFRKAMTGMSSLAVGISILFFCALWIAGGYGNFSSLDFLLASFVAPGFLTVMMIILMYNDLVFLRQRCERNWANIQVSLKKRATLIPQLERVVKRFLEHETDLQESLADMRTMREGADTAEEVDRYMELEAKSLATLNARIEDYPELKGDKLTADLNRRMIKLENEVALIRNGFNDAIMQYRTRIQVFPDNLLARIFGFRDRTPLSFEAEIREVPSARID